MACDPSGHPVRCVQVLARGDRQQHSRRRTFSVSVLGCAGRRCFSVSLTSLWNACRYNWFVYFVYMVRCADGTLYTGLARDPDDRLRVHNSGKGAKYTRSRLPVSLVYVEPCESLSAALKRERQLKPLSRAKKEALIAPDRV